MQSLLKRWRDNLSLFWDVLGIGYAFDDGRISPSQASQAIARAGHRFEIQRLDALEAEVGNRPERREGELANV